MVVNSVCHPTMTLATLGKAQDLDKSVSHPRQSPDMVSSTLGIPPCLVEVITTPCSWEADGLPGFTLVLLGVPCKHGRWNKLCVENTGGFMGDQ